MCSLTDVSNMTKINNRKEKQHKKILYHLEMKTTDKPNKRMVLMINRHQMTALSLHVFES